MVKTSLRTQRLLPDILLLTQAPIFVWFNGTITVYYYKPISIKMFLFCFCLVSLHGD